ncbi:MAG: CRISPR-associated endonuclease Cas2 [Bacteroidales bacterium]|nr:CRISPR-associated endonuclease Cas2 [Bacteroidales bacterium]
MHDSRWWLVCYDVRHATRLRKCAKVMEGRGHRVQYSVFRCWMSPRDLERLRWELTTILDPEDDVMMIPLCGDCVRGIRFVKDEERREVWPDTPPRYTIV